MRSTTARRRAVLGFAVGTSAALAVACGGGPAPSPAGLPGAPASSPGTGPSATGRPVQVRLTDFHIELPQQSFAPGSYTFTAVNEDDEPHALEIEGAGLDQRTDTLSAGQSATLTVTLGPGGYQLYCPVDGHRARGMETTITVSGAPNAPPASPTGGGGY